MTSTLPSSLDSAALARRLADLASDERAAQVDFLLHLEEFDRRRAYLDAGFGSLWDYCLRVLHLREGAAGRRIGAMRILRRFPSLEPALRDGRLCLSTASLLGQVLTEDNLEDLVERAAYRTKAEVEQLVVTIKPRPAPVEGVRRLSLPIAASTSAGETGPASATQLATRLPATMAPDPLVATHVPPAEMPVADGRIPPPASPPEVRPVSEDRWSVRVTLDAGAKAELDELTALLSHKIPDGDVGAVLREAIRCALEKHAVRRGASAPARERRPGVSRSERYVPAAVRREVWKRDGGRCTFVGPDGHRCESRWQLQFDHVTPVALGGTSTAADLRLRCRPHNLLEAERVFGRTHMERFRTDQLTTAPQPMPATTPSPGSAGPHGYAHDRQR
jgi:5-methylcytosine-specific restriction endonuclease McrA